MAMGTPLVLSDTAPVREFADADCAHLVDLSDPSDIADNILDLLDHPDDARARGQIARARMLATLRRPTGSTPTRPHWLCELASHTRSAPAALRPAAPAPSLRSGPRGRCFNVVDLTNSLSKRSTLYRWAGVPESIARPDI